MNKALSPRAFPCACRRRGVAPLLQISLCTFGYFYVTSNTALAQVTSDGTVNTQVNQNGNVAEITGGETRGGNLFHSFQDFSVTTNNEAFFNNATDVSNIFSRVTGGRASDIDGTIRANGNASLFLVRELDRKNHPMIRHYSKRYQRTTSQDQASLLVLDLISVEPELQTYPFLWA